MCIRDSSNILQHITPKDIRSFGLIPEIIGRLPVLTYLNPLDHFALKEILTKPRNSLIKQYEKLFEMDSINLKFTSSALDSIVKKAMEYKLGARGLRSLCESILTDAMFESPDSDERKLIITKGYVDQKISKIQMPNLRVVS